MAKDFIKVNGVVYRKVQDSKKVEDMSEAMINSLKSNLKFSNTALEKNIHFNYKEAVKDFEELNKALKIVKTAKPYLKYPEMLNDKNKPKIERAKKACDMWESRSKLYMEDLKKAYEDYFRKRKELLQVLRENKLDDKVVRNLINKWNNADFEDALHTFQHLRKEVGFGVKVLAYPNEYIAYF